MGIIEELVDAIVGDPSKGEAPLLGAPLKGEVQSLLQGGKGPGAGALGGLIQRFEQAGLGEVAHSWVGNGANRPVTAEQVRAALGPEQVRGMAQRTGLPEEKLLGHLAQILPQAVDRMTPEGRLPEAPSPEPSSGLVV